MGTTDGPADDVSLQYFLHALACLLDQLLTHVCNHVDLQSTAMAVARSSCCAALAIVWCDSSRCSAAMPSVMVLLKPNASIMDKIPAVSQVCCRGLPQQDQLQEGFAARQAHGCRCPRCGRLNHKQDNNNNMRCPFCTVNFCYLCKELLMARGSSGKHFGPKKACKQHSAD